MFYLTEKNVELNNEKEKLFQKIIQVKRVTKVVKGGKNLSFRVLLIVGNKKGKISIGVGKAKDVSSAIDKALLQAKKNLLDISVLLNKNIRFNITSSLGASKILLKSNNKNFGLFAGNPIRSILELSGFLNASSKILGSRNILNNCKLFIRIVIFLTKKFTTNYL